MSGNIWFRNASPTNPFELVEGAKATFICEYENATSITVADVELYLDGTGNDLASTYFPGEAHTDNGVNQITLDQLVVGNDANKVYIVIVTATLDGDTDVRKAYIKITPKKSKY